MSDDLLTRRGTMKMIPGAPPGRERPPYLRPVPTAPLPPLVVVAPAPDAIHHSSKAPERHQPFAVGDRIGVYIFLGHLGEGGLSYVYEVRHVHTGQTFALKCLNERALERPRLVERFVGEGKVLAFLSAHPHVVRVHEVGEDPRTGPFVVMEKLAGKTLRQVLEDIQRKGERMHPQIALYIAIQIALALHDIHQLAIVHRDLKPENIHLVPAAGGAGFDVKIIDWGAALSEFTAATSMSEHTVATPPYMSPEQACRRRITGASDQYSLAHILWELLMARHAFADAMSEAGRHDLVTLWQVNVEIALLPLTVGPRGLALAVGRAFSKDPLARWPSLKAFAQELQKYAEKDKKETPLSVPAHADAKPYRPTVLSAYRKPGERQETPRPAPIHEVRDPKPAVDLLAKETQPTLVVLVPPELRGQRVLLGDEGVLGRTSDQADLIFDHHTVSNRHARYRRVIQDADAPVYAIEDLDSLNGCFVGSSKDIARGLMLLQGVAPVKAYDVIGFGDVVALLVPAGGFRERDLAAFVPLNPPEEEDDARAVDPRSVPTHASSKNEPRWPLYVIVFSVLVIVYFGAALALQHLGVMTLPPLRP